MFELKLINLPLDVLVNVFKWLPLADLLHLMQTCKKFHDIVMTNNCIWKTGCTQYTMIRNSDNSIPSVLSWYNLQRIASNWRNGYYRNKVILSHHINYMPSLKFYNSEVLVLSIGSKLKCFPTDKRGLPHCKYMVWELDVPQVKRYDVRTNDISRFIIKNDVIACGNRDGCVAVYKKGDIKNTPTLVCHIEDCHEGGSVEVSAVEVIDGHQDQFKVVTSSDISPTICFWDCKLEKRPLVVDKVRTVHLSDITGVRCIALNRSQEELAFGLNGSNSPLLLDVATGQLLRNLKGNLNARQVVRDIAWHDPHTIVYVTHSGLVKLLDVRTGHLVFSAQDPFQSFLYCVRTDGAHAIIVGSSEYSRCVLFDWRKTNPVQMYFTQKVASPVYSLDFSATKLIAAVDRSVAVLNFNVNTNSVPFRDYTQAFDFVPSHRL